MADKVIITVAGDSRTSYPNNHLCPPQTDIPAVAKQYVDAVSAGAAITHVHGVRRLEQSMQADGRQVSILDHDGWRQLQLGITENVQPVMQFGVASARIADKLKLMDFGPDMMSVCFNAHDEYFQPDPAIPPNKMFAIHPQEELIEYAQAGQANGVKLEVECFHPGAFWNVAFLRRHGLLLDKPYLTLFLGWPGGAWTPPTERALIYMVDHLPENVVWNVSVMNPEKQWDLLALAIALGGNIRLGYEDNPYIRDGELAKDNAQLVERAVDLVHSLGRDVATPADARTILGLRGA